MWYKFKYTYTVVNELINKIMHRNTWKKLIRKDSKVMPLANTYFVICQGRKGFFG